MNIIDYIIQSVGIITIICIIAIIIFFIEDFVINAITNLKEEYKYKHRFDKLPTAKCYCIDCWYYNTKNKKCNKYVNLNIYTDDNYFCSEATPRRW